MKSKKGKTGSKPTTEEEGTRTEISLRPLPVKTKTHGLANKMAPPVTPQSVSKKVKPTSKVTGSAKLADFATGGVTKAKYFKKAMSQSPACTPKDATQCSSIKVRSCMDYNSARINWQNFLLLTRVSVLCICFTCS